jgi:phosphoserine phosphatase
MSDVVASDLEGTLTTGETWRILGEFLKSHGRAGQYNAFFYSRLPGFMLAKAKLINAQRFRESWFEGMTALLKGMMRPQIDALMAQIVDEVWAARRIEVIAELERHRANGARIIIASGTYQPAADAFAARMGAQAIATGLELDANGVATGRLLGNVSTGETKAARVRECLQGGVLIAAYGDTEGDIPMLSMSAQPVAVYPDAILRAKATASGWRILESNSVSP